MARNNNIKEFTQSINDSVQKLQSALTLRDAPQARLAIDEMDITLNKAMQLRLPTKNIKSKAAFSKRKVARLAAIRDKAVSMALSTAVSQVDLPMITLLIDKGANLDLRGPQGTPLVIAASQGDTVIIETLLSHGANINKRESFFGKTPLQAALKENQSEAAALLIQKDAKLGFNYHVKRVLVTVASAFMGIISVGTLLLRKKSANKIQNTQVGYGSIAQDEAFTGPENSKGFLSKYNRLKMERSLTGHKPSPTDLLSAGVKPYDIERAKAAFGIRKP